MTRLVSAFLLATTFLASPAFAQTIAPTDQKAREETIKTESVIGGQGPVDRAGGGSAFSALEFANEQGESEVKLALTFRLNKAEPVPLGDGVYRVSASKLTVTGQVPFDEKKGVSQLFKGESLVTGSKIKIGYTHFSTVLKDGRSVAGIEDETIIRCVHAETAKWKTANIGAENLAAADLFLEQFNVNSRTMAVDRAFTSSTGAPRPLAELVKSKCLSGDMLNIVTNYNSSRLNEYRGGFFTRIPAFFWGFDGSVGEDSYNSLDRLSFEIDEVERTSWDVGAYIGLIGDDLNWSVRARAAYGKTYASPDDGQICRTVTGATDPECIKGPDGLPKKNYTGLVAFEGRKLFSLDNLVGTNKIGVAPLVSYDFEKKNFNVELPIYLAPDKDGKLSGGLKLAYSSKEDDFGVGLFIGVPFSVFFD